MIWGVGTGRCGTHSLAADLGGLHEPAPWLGAASVAAYWGEAWALERCRDVIRRRLELGAPAIVDLHQSWLIPLICEVDVTAEFIWMLRDPAGCVASFLSAGAWTSPGKWPTLWQPQGGWPEPVRRFDRAVAYWAEVNLIIWGALTSGGRPWTMKRPADLRAHLGQGPLSAEWVFSPAEQRCLQVWHEVLYDGQWRRQGGD